MFEITCRDKKTKARVGILQTKSGSIETPFFMPVATKATAKYLSSSDLIELGSEAIICNSFILSLRPGVDVIKLFGGLSKFMNFPKLVFTDSGGFQMYTPSLYISSRDNEVVFRNPFSGERILMTPEKNMLIQYSMGADVVMCLDSMPLISDSREEIKKAVGKTTEWAKKCKAKHDNLQKELTNHKRQLLFGITQGGLYRDLREKSAKDMVAIDFDGYAIGGLALGEQRDKMLEIVKFEKKFLLEKKPAYLMGVGHPLDIVESISLGVDIFDSRFPTKAARHGCLLTWHGRLNILNSIYKSDIKSIDSECDCFVCKSYSRAYLRHLLMMNEGNGLRLASFHNLYFTQALIKRAAKAIKQGIFQDLLKKIRIAYQNKK